MRKAKITIALLAAVVVAHGSSAAYAEEDVPINMGELQDRIIRLESKQELLQKENSLIDSEIKIFEARERLQEAKSGTGPLPVIVALMQVNDKWIARLKNGDGLSRAYTVGEYLTQDTRIQSISQNGVMVSRKGGRPISLKYATAAQPQQQGMQGNSVPVSLQAPALWDKLPPLPAEVAPANAGSMR